jgi:hypothetical protein
MTSAERAGIADPAGARACIESGSPALALDGLAPRVWGGRRSAEMRGITFAIGLFAAAAIPAVASANVRCERQAENNQVAGTIIGGVAGGAIGNALSHGSAGGTAAGAIGGAILGNRLADASTRCPRGYVARYYSDEGPYAPNAYNYNSDTAYEGYAPGYGGYAYQGGYRDYDADRDRTQTWYDDNGRLCRRWPRVSYDAYGAPVQSWTTSCEWPR